MEGVGGGEWREWEGVNGGSGTLVYDCLIMSRDTTRLIQVQGPERQDINVTLSHIIAIRGRKDCEDIKREMICCDD